MNFTLPFLKLLLKVESSFNFNLKLKTNIWLDLLIIVNTGIKLIFLTDFFLTFFLGVVLTFKTNTFLNHIYRQFFFFFD